jgi:hypothetical protein
VTFNYPPLFLGKNGLIMEPESQVIQSILPKQLRDKEYDKKFPSIVESLGKTGAVLVSGHLVINIIL